VFESGVMQI